MGFIEKIFYYLGILNFSVYKVYFMDLSYVLYKIVSIL